MITTLTDFIGRTVGNLIYTIGNILYFHVTFMSGVTLCLPGYKGDAEPEGNLDVK